MGSKSDRDLTTIKDRIVQSRTESLGRKLLCLWADVAEFVAVRKNEAEVCEPL